MLFNLALTILNFVRTQLVLARPLLKAVRWALLTIGLVFAHYVQASPLLEWNTFLGGAADGTSTSAVITLDSSGNIFVVGSSNASWGSPINDHSGDGSFDTYVAKYNADGIQQWLTFIGGSASNVSPADIEVDGSGNIYVGGGTSATWGTPLLPFTGFGNQAFIAKLNSSGALQWHTFVGGSGNDGTFGIEVDGSGNVYATGLNGGTWGSPVVAHSAAGADAFAAKFNTSGTLLWNTFFGADSTTTFASDIEIDSSGNVYIAGYSNNTWGTSPVNAHAAAGVNNAFVLKLNTSGVRQWHTFMGPTSGNAVGVALAFDTSNNIYVTGSSNAWGTPIVSHSGNLDGFLAKFNTSGVRQWNTFFGDTVDESANDISINQDNEIFVVGRGMISTALTPFRPFSGGFDVYVTKHDTDGALSAFGYLGSASSDGAQSIESDSGGNIYPSGFSIASWGDPLVQHSAPGLANDGFFAKLCQDCFLVDTLAPEEEGFFEPETRVVHTNDTTTLDVFAKPGFRIDTVTGCGGTWSGNNPYVTGPITEACTIEATFKPDGSFYVIPLPEDKAVIFGL